MHIPIDRKFKLSQMVCRHIGVQALEPSKNNFLIDKNIVVVWERCYIFVGLTRWTVYYFICLLWNIKWTENSSLMEYHKFNIFFKWLLWSWLLNRLIESWEVTWRVKNLMRLICSHAEVVKNIEKSP